MSEQNFAQNNSSDCLKFFVSKKTFIDFSPLDSTSENKRRNCITVKIDSTQA